MPQVLHLSTDIAVSAKTDSHGLIRPPKLDLASHQLKPATPDCERVAWAAQHLHLQSDSVPCDTFSIEDSPVCLTPI